MLSLKFILLNNAVSIGSYSFNLLLTNTNDVLVGMGHYEDGSSSGPTIDSFTSDTEYIKGQIILYNNILYRCIVPHTSESSIDLSKWEQITPALEDWSPSSQYSKDDLVIYNGKLYRCNDDHISGSAFDSSKFELVNSLFIPDGWNVSTVYLAGELVIYDGILLLANDTHTSDSVDIAVDLVNGHWSVIYLAIATWTSGTIYQVGTLVLYNNRVYRCVSAHVSTNNFDFTKWALLIILDNSNVRMIETPKLKLLLIQEDWKFADDSFNLVIRDMDNKLLGIGHAKSTVHWGEWKTGYSYSKGDIIRISNGKSNQYYYCVTNGISGVTEPINNIAGSIVNDGTVQWKVCTIGDSEGSASVDIFRGGTSYNKGQLVIYGNVLYRSKVAHIAASTMELDSDKWQQADASPQEWKADTYFSLDNIVLHNNKLYKCILAHTSGYSFDYTKWTPIGSSTLLDDWKPSTRYEKGQLILYKGLVLQASDTHTSDGTDIATDIANNHWKLVFTSLPEWSSNVTYKVGTLVLYDNKIYKCITEHTSTATFDPSKWEMILSLPVIDEWNASTSYFLGQLVLNHKNLYRANVGHTSSGSSILPDMSKWDLVYANIGDWEANTEYKSGQYVLYDGKLYKCNTDHTSTSDFDPSKWDVVLSLPVLTTWSTGTPYLSGQLVLNGGVLLKSTDNHTSNGSAIISDLDLNNMHWDLAFASVVPWASNTTYKVGTNVLYNNNLYKCISTHTSGSDFDNTKWELVGQADAFVHNWTPNHYYKKDQVVIKDKEIYRSKTSHTSASTWDGDKSVWDKISSETIIDNWKSNTEYLANEIVMYNGVAYRCKTAHTSGSDFDASKWEFVNANAADWESNTKYNVGSLVVYNNQLYRCTTAHTSSSDFETDATKWQPVANNVVGIPLWETDTYYYLNQIVKHNGKVWRCIVPHKSNNKDEQPDMRLVYSSSTSFLHVDQNTSLPVSATVDLGAIYLASDIEVETGGGYMTITGVLEGSIDNINFTKICDFSGREVGPGQSISLDSCRDVRYLRFTVNTKSLPSSLTFGSVSFNGLKVWGNSDKWELLVGDSIRLIYWDKNTNYTKGDTVLYNDDYYTCIESHTSSNDFDITKWQKVSETALDIWEVNKLYRVDKTITYNGSIWVCKIEHTSSATDTPEETLAYEDTSTIDTVDDNTTLPATTTIDLGDTYKINKLLFDLANTNAGVTSLKVGFSEDNVSWEYVDYPNFGSASNWPINFEEDYSEEEHTARYIQIVTDSVDSSSGTWNIDISNLKVLSPNDKWEEASTMNTLDDSDIDDMFE